MLFSSLPQEYNPCLETKLPHSRDSVLRVGQQSSVCQATTDARWLSFETCFETLCSTLVALFCHHCYFSSLYNHCKHLQNSPLNMRSAIFLNLIIHSKSLPYITFKLFWILVSWIFHLVRLKSRKAHLHMQFILHFYMQLLSRLNFAKYKLAAILIDFLSF